jgi:hypothetical protein
MASTAPKLVRLMKNFFANDIFQEPADLAAWAWRRELMRVVVRLEDR